jgi:hypothetical protein
MNVAEQLKMAGMERAAKKYEADLIRAQMVAEVLGHGGALVTSDDVRSAFFDHYQRELKIHNAMGSIFTKDKWELAGFVRSKRPESHARMIRTWRMKGVQKALDATQEAVVQNG